MAKGNYRGISIESSSCVGHKQEVLVASPTPPLTLDPDDEQVLMKHDVHSSNEDT